VEGDHEYKTGQETSTSKEQGTWARSNIAKAHVFTEHLANVFQPHPPENEPEKEEALTQLLETPYQLEPPINHLIRAEDQEVIKSLNPI
jgi:hypothetical protein